MRCEIFRKFSDLANPQYPRVLLEWGSKLPWGLIVSIFKWDNPCDALSSNLAPSQDKQVETAFIISVDVVALWITTDFASFVHFSDSWNASALRHNKRGSTPPRPTKKRNRRPNLFGKCCFNLASFPVSCLYPVSFHMLMFLCWWATCPLPLHSRVRMYVSAKQPILQAGQVWCWLCRPKPILWMHFSDAT